MINIEQLKASVDIVEIISDRIELKKTGANYTACCPFHSEKTPSFNVSQTKQFYHCFGCGAGGDIVDFIQKYENVDFITAAKILGGEEIDGDYTPPPPKIKPQWEIEKEKRDLNFKRDLLQDHIDDMHYADKSPMFDYFASRGITDIAPALSSDVGFIDNCRYDKNDNYQAIFTIVTDRFGRTVTGHRTFLNEGNKFHRGLMPSLSHGASSSCSVRAITSDSNTLILAEGLETLLSIYVLNGGRDANYWSTITSGGMSSLSIPARFNKIEIYADIDVSCAGQNAAMALAQRYDAKIFYPAKKIPDDVSGFDFNDLLKQQKGIEQ